MVLPRGGVASSSFRGAGHQCGGILLNVLDRGGRVMRYSILICCLLALVSCVSIKSQAPQGTQAVNTPSGTILPLSKQAAIDRAIALASQPRPELNAAQVPPRLVQAEQMILAAAFQRFMNDDTVPAGNDPNLSVWVVTLEGVWTSGMPAPT